MNIERADPIRPYTRFQRKLDSLCDFPSVIEQFFNPYICAAGNARIFEWSAVEKFYNDSQDTLSICYALRMFCEFVLKLFQRFNCEHERLMIRILYLYSEVRRRRCPDVFGEFCRDCEQLKCRKYHHLNSRPFLRELNENKERIYMDYTFGNPQSRSHKRIGPSYFTQDYTYNDELRYQVQYGLIIIPNCEIIAAVGFNHMRHRYYEMRSLPERYQHDEELWHDFVFAKKVRNFRRLILILDVMSNCTLNDGKYDHAKRFGAYTLTLTEPAISQKEVQEFLDFSFADDETYKTYAFSSFMEVFVHSPKLLSPRSLKHLCRCKIRDCLPRSPSLPSLLFQIELLPNYLKEYILFLCN